jgi:NSS family neurotransmitter:Na+ symporter
MLVLSMPCILGFNLWAQIQPLKAGKNIMDLEDFIVSNCLLPLGSLVLVLFCTRKSGWSWENFVAEANTGTGAKVRSWMRGYMTWVLPVIVIALFVVGIISFFKQHTKTACRKNRQAVFLICDRAVLFRILPRS